MVDYESMIMERQDLAECLSDQCDEDCRHCPHMDLLFTALWDQIIYARYGVTNMEKQDIIILCRAARKARGFTLKELSARTNYHYTALSKFEHGLYSWDIAESYFREVLNDVERATYIAVKERITEK